MDPTLVDAAARRKIQVRKKIKKVGYWEESEDVGFFVFSQLLFSYF